jgi:hypothetical protein
MTATNQHDHPPVPEIRPEPAHLNGNNTEPAAPAEERDVAKQGRGNPVRIILEKLVSALRGDKYMVDAYPSAGREDAPALDDRGSKARER